MHIVGFNALNFGSDFPQENIFACNTARAPEGVESLGKSTGLRVAITFVQNSYGSEDEPIRMLGKLKKRVQE